MSPLADPQSFPARSEPGIVLITGSDAGSFLDGVLTTNVSTLKPGDLGYGALLSPQGKIQHELFVYPVDNGVILELTAKPFTQRFIQRLSLLKLRADVVIEDLSETWRGYESIEAQGGGVAAPSLLGGPAQWGLSPATMDDDAPFCETREAHVEHGLPRQGVDYGFEEVFPTDVNMDLRGGVDYAKGCFIGQEVVSRMRRRGTIRKRTVVFKLSNPPSDEFDGAVFSGAIKLGRITSHVANLALAILRTDTLANAGGPNAALTIDGVPAQIASPAYTTLDALGIVEASTAR